MTTGRDQRHKKHGRARARAEALRKAAALNVPKTADVCIIGGGAAGLVAALSAAQAGASVVVLERADACGKTILATGNGRCNFANEQLLPEFYNNPTFVKQVLDESSGSGLTRILDLFQDCGMAWTSIEGRLYPRSLSAASVRDVLLGALTKLPVILATHREVQSVDQLSQHAGTSQRPHYKITYTEPQISDNAEQSNSAVQTKRTLLASSVVIACGGALTGAAYSPNIAQTLGLASTPTRPGLCALACRMPEELQQADGRRTQCSATLMRNGKPHAQASGEVLFRTYGLSGVVMFDLSRFAQPGDEIVLDLAPDLSETRIQELCSRTHSPAHALSGIFDPVLAQALEAYARTTASPALGQLVKGLRLSVEGTADKTHAQITCGGFETNLFDPQTLEAHALPGCFACGEALDVDGACGGFNLAWAWLSGMRAGNEAANRSMKQTVTNPTDV